VRGLCASGNTVDVIRGRAGTDKSAMLAAYRHALQLAGVPITGVAPSATAAHLLGDSADLPGSRTAHRLLAEVEHREDQLAPGGVVICDEAGMTDTRTLLNLLRQADDVGGKLVLVGSILYNQRMKSERVYEHGYLEGYSDPVPKWGSAELSFLIDDASSPVESSVQVLARWTVVELFLRELARRRFGKESSNWTLSRLRGSLVELGISPGIRSAAELLLSMRNRVAHRGDT